MIKSLYLVTNQPVTPMKACAIVLIAALGILSAAGQDILLTFTATGDAVSIDQITATNLRTGESVTLPGNETLRLTANSGIDLPEGQSLQCSVYPNPFPGMTAMVITLDTSEKVNLSVCNLIGQTVVQMSKLLPAGKNHFDLALSTAGVYSIVLETARGKISTKVVCTAALTGTDQITSAGEVSGPLVTKAAKSGYSLGFLENDRIHFRCTSGQMTAMVLESPRESGRVTVEFAACIDGSGVHYPVIKIGDQKWMAKNLAYLPSVSHPDTNSDTEKLYYVYGYEGTDVMEAKATENYGTYGVLYNWPAAMNGALSSTSVPSGIQGACPSGWHLPSEGEWDNLKTYLKTNGFAYTGTTEGIGKSMASTSGWMIRFSPGAVGFEQETNNSSGFSAPPAGKRMYDGRNGVLSNKGQEAMFWASNTRSSDNLAASRGLHYTYDYLWTGYSLWFSAFSIRCVKD